MMNDQLSHKQALYELMCRYCSAVDSRNFDHLESLYTSSAIHDHGPMFSGNPKDLIHFLQETMIDMTTQHMIGNHLYFIDGHTAQGEIYTINTHIFHRESNDIEYTAGGRYIDNYHYDEKSERWLISARKRLIDWTREGSSSPSALQFSNGDQAHSKAFLRRFV